MDVLHIMSQGPWDSSLLISFPITFMKSSLCSPYIASRVNGFEQIIIDNKKLWTKFVSAKIAYETYGDGV